MTTAAGADASRAQGLTFERLVVAVTLLGVLAMAARVSMDSDTWWHLRAGEWMLAERQVLTRDVFSGPFNGRAWDYPAWLSQIGLHLIFARFGFAGLNWFTALCAAAAFGLVLAAAEGRVLVRAAATLFGAVAGAVFWSARPHMLSLVLTAAFLLVLEGWRRGGRNRLWLLPPLMALWANLHPGFANGFIVLGLTLAGEAGRAALGRQRWRVVGWLAGCGLACAAALLISPYGPDLLTFPFRTLSIGVLRDHIQEWQSPNFHLREAQPFIWLLLAVLAAVGLSRRGLDLTDWLLVAVTAYLALLAGRNVALFALAAPPVLARHADAALSRLRRARRAPPARPPRLAWLFNWTILALVAGLAGLKVAYVSDAQLNAELVTRDLPVAAADFLERARPAGPLFNPYEWGGYLAWRLYPDYLVFVDGRTDLYPDEFLRAYLQAASGLPGWDAVLERYGIRLALVRAHSPLAALLEAHPGWRSIYADDLALVFAAQP